MFKPQLRCSLTRCALLSATLLLSFAAGAAHPPSDIRVSVKFILDDSENMPSNSSPGFGNLSYALTTHEAVVTNIAFANQVLIGSGSEYQLRLCEITNLSGVSEWYEVAARNNSTRVVIEAAALADPETYAYRNDAINIYINNTSSGVCSLPPGYEALSGTIILAGSSVAFNTLLHEVGHFFGLGHTHDYETFRNADNTPCNDGCDCERLVGGFANADAGTLQDHQCWDRDTIALTNFNGTHYEMLTTDQQLAVNNTWLNIMSYHKPAEPRLTAEQLAIWRAVAAGPRFNTVTEGRLDYAKASNTGAHDQFGYSVSVSGNTMVVGAPFEDSNAAGIDGNQDDNSMDGAGAAYVFTSDGTNWTQQAYLKANAPGRHDWFGYSVAVSGDTIVVGAPNENSGDEETGAAHVFVRSGMSWSEQATLKPLITGAGDSFGRSVAISDDTVVVGADGESSSAAEVNGDWDDNSAPNSGAAYVFARTGTTWQQQAYLKASNSELNDLFGHSVAISGNTLVVGARNEDSSAVEVNGDPNDNSAPNSGAAYVFVYTGTIWQQRAYLKAFNTGAEDKFGFSVAVSGDTVVVGASEEDSNSTGVNSTPNEGSLSSGAAYVFERRETTWHHQAYLKASNTGTLDKFGWSVAAASSKVVIGARFESSNATGINGNEANDSVINAGAAYVFVHNGTTWQQQAYLKACNTGGLGETFGNSVAVSGETIVVGANYESSNGTGVNGNPSERILTQSGAAYVFADLHFPEIAVEDEAGYNFIAGSAVVDFGSIPLGISSPPRRFTIRNTGPGVLAGLNITSTPDFTIEEQPTPEVPPGGSTHFTVLFTPHSLGGHFATLSIASNERDENPFDITLTGTGVGGEGPQLEWLLAGGGRPFLLITGPPNSIVLVQRATDLRGRPEDWITVETLVLSPEGTAFWADPSPQTTQGFYRTFSPP